MMMTECIWFSIVFNWFTALCWSVKARAKSNQITGTKFLLRYNLANISFAFCIIKTIACTVWMAKSRKVLRVLFFDCFLCQKKRNGYFSNWVRKLNQLRYHNTHIEEELIAEESGTKTLKIHKPDVPLKSIFSTMPVSRKEPHKLLLQPKMG